MSPIREQLLAAIETAPEPILEELLTLINDRLQQSPTTEKSETPLWQIAAEVTESIPPATWATLPTDLSANFDQYQQRHHQA